LIPDNKSQEICVVCKEGFKDSNEMKDAYGFLCHLSTSEITRQINNYGAKELQKIFLSNTKEIMEAELIPDEYDSITTKAFYLDSCNHLMHYECLKKNLIIGVVFLCPLCGCIADSIIPIIKDISIKDYDYCDILSKIDNKLKKEINIKELDNIDDEDQLRKEIYHFTLISINMINMEDVIGMKASSLKIISVLRNVLKLIRVLEVEYLSEEEKFEGILNLAKNLENSWISDPIVSPFIYILFNFFKIDLVDPQSSFQKLSEMINRIVNLALESIIKRLFMYNYCISNKTLIFHYSQWDSVLKGYKNSEIINKELIRYLKKFLLIKLVFIPESIINILLEDNWRSLIINSNKLSDEDLIIKSFNCFDIKGNYVTLSSQKCIEE